MTVAPAALVSLDHDDTDGVDTRLAITSASALLAALGLDTSGEHLRNTAARMVASYRELLAPAPFAETTFENCKPHKGFVIVRDVPFAAVCAHHVLPFIGCATVGYQPGSRLLGLSKLARIVDRGARGLQVQEDMTEDIADDVRGRVAGRRRRRRRGQRRSPVHEPAGRPRAWVVDGHHGVAWRVVRGRACSARSSLPWLRHGDGRDALNHRPRQPAADACRHDPLRRHGQHGPVLRLPSGRRAVDPALVRLRPATPAGAGLRPANRAGAVGSRTTWST